MVSSSWHHDDAAAAVRSVFERVGWNAPWTTVPLAFSDGRTEFIDNAHVHGYREHHLLVATGDPGAGLDAEVVRTVTAPDGR